MTSDKNRVTLQLIFFIMFGNLFLDAHLLLSDNPNKLYVILALIVLYITSVCALIWVGLGNNEGHLVTQIEDDEFIRLKSNGRRYSKLRGHVSKRTRARQPWVGARKVEREV